MPPTCCPFHESGGPWDAGHSQARTGGFYGGPVEVAFGAVTTPAVVTYGREFKEVDAKALLRSSDAWDRGIDPAEEYDFAVLLTALLPCEALRSRDPGAS